MNKTNKLNKKPRYRTVWISDVHLGTPGCQAEELAKFLKHIECDQLYLIGDIIDGWRLRNNFYWPQSHSNVIRRILTKAKRGTKISYITGNHDQFLRKFVDYNLVMGNLEILNETVHETADGRRLLVVHGDMFDVITRYHRWIAIAGDAGYNVLLRANRHIHKIRRRLGLPYWSLANAAKQTVKSAVNFISDYEQAVAYEAHKRELDGVVCGHIHQATVDRYHNVDYYNSGDWVESCTALVEDRNGKISVMNWLDEAADYNETSRFDAVA